MIGLSLRALSLAVGIGASLGLAGCSRYLPSDGPLTGTVESAPENTSLHGIELVKVNYGIAAELRQEAKQAQFAASFSGPIHADHKVSSGDVLAIYIWEAPPAVLFTSQTITAQGLAGGGTGTVSLPPQTVDNAGNIRVPFAGTIHVAGLTVAQIESQIAGRLAGKANDPQVIARLASNNTQDITVVGDIRRSMEVPVTPGGVRLLRAIALAGGVTKPVSKTSIQLSRDGKVAVLPLETILRDPSENVPLRGGDVVTALYQPLNFTILGATGRNAEVSFEASGISLAQAIARAGGLNDNRSNPAGVFVFRFAKPSALKWPTPPKLLVHGKVPVIFQFNLRDPATFFAAEAFPVHNNDLIYVSNAPVTDLQKVLNVVSSIVYPFQTLQTAGVIK
ncbi:MAG TPA: polysaccharide biosynthesis/export family protein [Acidiphilium sp.]|nr:polysaccharide biosynthesis/export family protein [Acidiphilium sp.]HQU11756.1 polysaccharide biosynthesis/export family protein [Acidiphilium sp.]